MNQRRSSTGYASVDTAIDDLWMAINDSMASSSTTIIGGTTLTTEGGIAVPITNGSGVRLYKGYLVTTGSGIGIVDIAAIGEHYLSGVIYEEIAPYKTGLMVITGFCDVYFNSGGSTLNEYFRINKTGDTGATNGYAESSDRYDNTRTGGQVNETRSGEGIARCLLRR